MDVALRNHDAGVSGDFLNSDWKFDRYNNVIPQSGGFHHENATAGEGSFGENQYAEFQKSDQDGYGVEIPHGQSAAFNNPANVYVANDR